MSTLRASALVIELMVLAPWTPSGADLDLSLGDLTLASGASAAAGPAPLPGNPAQTRSLVIEVVHARHPTHACTCMISPRPAPAKYLMRRAARVR